MPVSIVVGGQFGSEGKGKVALEIVRRCPDVRAVVRVGGSNSGHTAVDQSGRTRVLRQIPAAAIDGNVCVVLPPGSFIDLDVFLREVNELGMTPDSLFVSPMARVITQQHKDWEREGKLNAAIGSTESGTGASVLAMVARGAPHIPLQSVQAIDVPELARFVSHEHDTTKYLRNVVSRGERVVIEGTQGFGLSVLQGGYWPKATSRDTTAAGFLSEAGLSPRDVDDVTLVIRCHPIRVAGDSGDLPNEITWEEIMRKADFPYQHREYTTVTQRLRRVAHFDAELVLRAIDANWPSRVVLNHIDYVDYRVRDAGVTARAEAFVRDIEKRIGHAIDWLGVAPDKVIERTKNLALTR
jgi:adenylosuccinate synthase